MLVQLLRVKLLKSPPSWVRLNGEECRFDLAIGIQDDYGVDVDTFGLLEVTIQIIDATTGLPLPSLVPTFAKSSPPSSTAIIDPLMSRFHSLSVCLVPRSTIPATTKAIRFVVSARSTTVSTVYDQDSDTVAMLNLIGEGDQEPCEGWDGRRYIFMRATSGDVELMLPFTSKGSKTSKTNGGKGKDASQNNIGTTKVQTVIRTITLPSAESDSFSPISIIERPGLNNSTGQRLWDCSIALSLYLSLHPDFLAPSHRIESPMNEPPESKRVKRDDSRSKVIELGAGCALVSLVVSRILQHQSACEVIATDVMVTVETTLEENLAENDRIEDKKGTKRGRIRAEVLDWGTSSIEDMLEMKARILGGGDEEVDVTILGSDLLYNPESHSVLLETLLFFLRPPVLSKKVRRALIAYKHRTESDDDFFRLAEAKGLNVKMVWNWGVIQVWHFD